MKKKVLSVLLAGCICCPMMAMASYGETPVHALTIIASVTNISVFKDTIAVGESVQLELEWSTGAEQMVYYSSSDESIATVNQNGLVTGIGNGTAIITLSHSNIGTDKTIAINVSEDAEISKTYNTSELTLEAKLKKYDTLHYTGTGAGSCLNVVNTEGGYTPVLLIDDYIITSSENGLESEQYYRVVTANGSRYSTEAFVVDTELGYEWTVKDDVNLIMTEGEKEQYIQRLISTAGMMTQTITQCMKNYFCLTVDFMVWILEMWRSCLTTATPVTRLRKCSWIRIYFMKRSEISDLCPVRRPTKAIVRCSDEQNWIYPRIYGTPGDCTTGSYNEAV